MRDLEDLKEIKVALPAQLHNSLHVLKALRGQSISRTVTLALEDYFAKHAPGAPPLAPSERRPR